MLQATIEGIGFWAHGLPSWDAARAFANGAALVDGAPTRPSPQLLPANERRRAPETVAVALDVALAACQSAAQEPSALSSVFASRHGDMGITDYICATLASDPRSLSPTRFHNSVHNAAAGYWTIGAGAMRPATAISAGAATFAQGLLEAMAQVHCDGDTVLLVAYDGAATGAVAASAPSEGLLGGALVLSPRARAGSPVLRMELGDGEPTALTGPLSRLAAGNAMAAMLPLFDALAGAPGRVALPAGDGRVLQIGIE